MMTTSGEEKAKHSFPSCDVCLHESCKVEPTNYYCKECELALCKEHIKKHMLDEKTDSHKIYDPRTGNLINNQITNIGDDESDDDVEIIDVNSIPISVLEKKEDDFEHHQIFLATDSTLDVNNLTEEEEEIISLGSQDFIYRTRLLKTYPHFSTNIIHTPLIIRKLYTNGTLNGSLMIDNRTQHPIIVILSQVGPLHQMLIPPHRLGIFEGLGRVHFTV